MQHFNLCILGFGNVGKALAQLLQRKTDELRDRYGIEFSITGISSRRIGWLVNPNGLNVDDVLNGGSGGAITPAPNNLLEWLKAAKADVLFELTSLNPETGQPAIDYLKTALENGIHAVTGNKGPVVHGFHALRDLAQQNGKRFLFEATVMGGAPIFSLFRSALLGAKLLRFRAVLNSTTNLMITEMENGATFDEAVKKAQDLGIAETDPSNDVDGWDAAVKVSALATVLMDVPVTPQMVNPTGIRALTPEMLRTARVNGMPYKLICTAEKRDGRVMTSVRPEQIPLSDPLAEVRGASSMIQFELDTIYGLTLSEQDPDAITTAYGPLADFIAIATQG